MLRGGSGVSGLEGRGGAFEWLVAMAQGRGNRVVDASAVSVGTLLGESLGVGAMPGGMRAAVVKKKTVEGQGAANG